MKQIGANLRRIRRTADITQEALGRSVGVSGAQIRHYEKGVSDIPATRLRDICEALGANVQDMFE